MAVKLQEHESPHSEEVQKWVAAVEQRHTDFSRHMEQYKKQLETTLGIQNRQPKAETMSTSNHKDRNRELNEASQQ